MLEMIGSIYLGSGHDEIAVFQFVFEDVDYFALSGAAITAYPTAEMTVEDLYLQHLGASWIAERDPIDLAALRSADGGISSTTQHWASIEEMASPVCQTPRILEALYLRQTGDYLVLVEDRQTQTAWVIGDKLKPQAIAFPQASTGRRLALGMGVVLAKADLFQTGPIKVTVRWIFRALAFVLMLLWAYPTFIVWQDKFVMGMFVFTSLFAMSCLLAFLLFNSVELTPEAIVWKTLCRTKTIRWDEIQSVEWKLLGEIVLHGENDHIGIEAFHLACSRNTALFYQCLWLMAGREETATQNYSAWLDPYKVGNEAYSEEFERDLYDHSFSLLKGFAWAFGISTLALVATLIGALLFEIEFMRDLAPVFASFSAGLFSLTIIALVGWRKRKKRSNLKMSADSTDEMD